MQTATLEDATCCRSQLSETRGWKIYPRLELENLQLTHSSYLGGAKEPQTSEWWQYEKGGGPHNSWLIKPASMASEQSIGRRKISGRTRESIGKLFWHSDWDTKGAQQTYLLLWLYSCYPPTKVLFEEWETVQKLGQGHSRQRDENKQETERYTPAY